MKTYEIVHSTKEDLDFACYLFEEAMEYQKRKGYPQYLSTDRAVLEEDIENKLQFKVLIENEIASMFTVCYSDKVIWREKDKNDAIYLHRVVVNPNYKGQRQFGKILDWTLRKAQEEQIPYVRLDTWADNPDLENYYKSFGFEAVGHYTAPDLEELSINTRGNKVVMMEWQAKKKPYTKKEIEKLIKQFEKQSLPKEEWTHTAHLIVSVWYSKKYNGEVLLDKIKNRISRYNEAVGTPNTKNSGYHETITRFWLHTTQSYLKNNPFNSLEAACNAFIHSEFAKKDYPMEYYSKELLFSEKARLNWVAPDLKNLGSTKMKKYLIIEHFHKGKVKAIYERFEKKGRLLPAGVHYIDSWVDANVSTCYQLMESESIEGIQEWIDHWKDLTDFEIVPVLTSQEVKEKVFQGDF